MKNKIKKILYIDLDGVVFDFDLAIKEICPELETSDDFPDYETRSKKVDEIVENNRDLFHNLKPIGNSVEIVKDLMNHYEVYFLSTPMWNIPESFTGKRISIEKHFGHLAEKKLILTHRKDLAIGDYLVDDRTRNGAGEFTGKHIHLWSNEFPNWDVTYKFLLENHEI